MEGVEDLRAFLHGEAVDLSHPSTTPDKTGSHRRGVAATVNPRNDSTRRGGLKLRIFQHLTPTMNEGMKYRDGPCHPFCSSHILLE